MALLFSYVPIANATAIPGRLDVGLIMLGLALAPFPFVVAAFVSRNPSAPKRVLQAMGLFVLLGLPVGLFAPVLGAAAGFGAGVVLCLNQLPLSHLLRNRWWAVVFSVAYSAVLLGVTEPAAGIPTGAILPPLMVGIADEYSAWADGRRRH